MDARRSKDVHGCLDRDPVESMLDSKKNRCMQLEEVLRGKGREEDLSKSVGLTGCPSAFLETLSPDFESALNSENF